MKISLGGITFISGHNLQCLYSSPVEYDDLINLIIMLLFTLVKGRFRYKKPVKL